MDEGWTRWLLEEFGFSYTSVHNADIQAGGLRNKFDAIVIPDQPTNSIENGHRAGTMPQEYTGGLGPEGAGALKRFWKPGGSRIFLDRPTATPVFPAGRGADSEGTAPPTSAAGGART